jgi:glutaredoxin
MHFTIYSKDNCKYCEMAKTMLDRGGMDYDVLKIGADITVERLQEKVTATGSDVEVRAVPQVFQGDTYIGGASNLLKYLKSL